MPYHRFFGAISKGPNSQAQRKLIDQNFLSVGAESEGEFKNPPPISMQLLF